MSTKNLTKAFSKITLNESIQNQNSIPSPTPDNPHGSEDTSKPTKTGQMLTKVPESIHSHLSLFFSNPFWYEKYLLEPGVRDLLLKSQTQDPFDRRTDYNRVVSRLTARESKSQFYSHFKERFGDAWHSPFEDLMKFPQGDYDM